MQRLREGGRGRGRIENLGLGPTSLAMAFHRQPIGHHRIPTARHRTGWKGTKTKVGKGCWEREPERQREIEDIKGRAREQEKERERERERKRAT